MFINFDINCSYFFLSKIDQFKNLFLNMLVTDGVYNSRSISYDVSTPNEISNMFDSITYSKVGFFKKIYPYFLNGFIIL